MNAQAPSDVSTLVDALPKPESIANPYPLYERLRDATPVYGYRDYPPGTVPGQDEAVTAWVLMKYDQVAEAARDHNTFSSRDPLQDQSAGLIITKDNQVVGRNPRTKRRRIGTNQRIHLRLPYP